MGGVWNLFYTPIQAYCDDSNVLINLDNSNRRKVPYDLGGMHTKLMGMKRDETAFVFHLIDQVVY